ncbi:MAG: peptidoglycan-binding protein [bacterium]
MLPTMFTNTKRNLIAGVTAAAVLVAGAAPAMAWGKGEQQFLAGIVATLAVTQLIKNSPKYGNPAPVYQPAPRPQYRYYRPTHQRPVYYQPAPVSIYGTPVGRAFNSYTSNERRRIQSTLTAYGYYHGGIDGAFGNGTYSAIDAYARHTGKTAMLGTSAGSYGLLDGLLF